MSSLFTAHTSAQLDALARLVQSFYHRGWVPATSSNFSIRHPEQPEYVLISKSGIDKEFISRHDFMIVDQAGQPLPEETAKPSAETLLHTTLYQYDTVGAVLHTHSPTFLLAAEFLAKDRSIKLENLELLKAFPGIHTHEATLTVPVFPNSQNMQELSRDVLKTLTNFHNFHGYIIEGHGAYVWGANIEAAKRHLESLEYLLGLYLRRLAYGRH